jgi:hypothetical protein
MTKWVAVKAGDHRGLFSRRTKMVDLDKSALKKKGHYGEPTEAPNVH